MERTPHKPKVSLTLMKALRLSSGMTLQYVEEHGGINMFTYIKIESGNRRGSRPSIKKICDLFSLRHYFLFDREGFAIRVRPTEVVMLAQYKRVRRKK